MADPINLQHVNVKIFAEELTPIDLADAVPVFHRWIQENVCEELLVDVADYRHVPAGPGILLVAHEANYSLDCAFNRLGLLYSRKAVVDGDTHRKLDQAFRAALEACLRLEQEPPFQGKLKFNAGDCEILVNDRLLVPNTEETWIALKPALEGYLRGIYGPLPFSLERVGEPRERFRVGVKTAAPVAVRSLLEARQPA